MEVFTTYKPEHVSQAEFFSFLWMHEVRKFQCTIFPNTQRIKCQLLLEKAYKSSLKIVI